MPLHTFGRRLATRLRAAASLASVAIIAGVTLLPLLTQSASATTSVQLVPRQEAVTTANPGATFTASFVLDVPSSAIVQGAKFEFCDAPLGSCTTSNTPTIPASSTVSQNAKWTDATAFGTYTKQAGDDGGAGNQILVTRSSTTSETATGASCDTTYPIVAANCRSISFTGLTNNAGANKTYYVRMKMYNVSSAFNDTVGTGNQVYYGVVAQSTSQTISVNARVQEHLDFCVGTTTVDDATTDPATTTHTCADITGSTVDIGTISNAAVSISPVAVSPNGGNAVNGIAMVASNGSNGTVLSYFGQVDGTCTSAPVGHCAGLKITGQNCAATIIGSSPSFTDKCFNDSTTATAFGAGVEGFGVTVGKVNTADLNGAYTGANLVPATQYNGNCTGTACTTFAWDDTGSTNTIADSSSSSTKVVNYESLILKFGARAAATTPTGQYTVASTYIATSSY